MANRFTDSFQSTPNMYNSANNGGFDVNQLNECANNPIQFLANHGINVPTEYQNSPEQTAKYLLGNLNNIQQNFVMQKVNTFKGMMNIFGMFRR